MANDVSATMIYTHVLKIAAGTTASSLNKLMQPTITRWCLNVR